MVNEWRFPGMWVVKARERRLKDQRLKMFVFTDAIRAWAVQQEEMEMYAEKVKIVMLLH